MLFGGDLGRYDRPVLQDPSTVESADALVLESTYGDREHEPDDQGLALAEIVNSTVRRGGRVIIPAFAIGRVEELLYVLKKLEDTQQIPVLPVYVDLRPMTALKGMIEKRLGWKVHMPELGEQVRLGES